MAELPKVRFPHEFIRPIQQDMIKDVLDAVSQKKHLICHAPTGLGKTAASLAPALAHALQHGLTVFFLTSRHTQHKIALDTIQRMRELHGVSIRVADIIGKKWMCLQDSVHTLRTRDFMEYCKHLREEGNCSFYSRVRDKGKVSVEAQKALSDLASSADQSTAEVYRIGKRASLCPYELSILHAKEADVIISDYYYLFSPGIRQNFLKKIGKELSKSIIIVDEGHNLPSRCRELLTQRLTASMLERAEKEAAKYQFNESASSLAAMRRKLGLLAASLLKGSVHSYTKNEEVLVEKGHLTSLIQNYDEFIVSLLFIAEEARSHQKQSFVAGVAEFLESWLGPDEGYARILERKEQNLILSSRCLDPSIVSVEVAEEAHSVILMSGTLTPTSMFRDLLSFRRCDERVYESPFPRENRKCLVVPLTTTQYAKRNDEQFSQIAMLLSAMANDIPGNTAIFFPSYFMRDRIAREFEGMCIRTIFREDPTLTSQEKQDMIARFASYQKHGAVLLGVSTGSFGEGIDLPGDALKAVIVVGLPLERPSLEIQQLISYYDRRFGRGWDYGYVFPAITKTLQNAGRCIRSETDRGMIIFLDERYAWPRYLSCLPKDLHVEVTRAFQPRIREFYRNA